MIHKSYATQLKPKLEVTARTIHNHLIIKVYLFSIKKKIVAFYRNFLMLLQIPQTMLKQGDKKIM